MLKNKRIIYVLLPIVLFIWGTVLFKIFNAFGDDEGGNIAVKEKSFKPLRQISRDTFQISSYERDPFLDTKQVKKITSVKTGTKKKVEKKPFKKWPKISYKGRVSDKKSNKSLYVLEISSQIYFLKLKDKIEEITLTKVEEDKAFVRFKNETKEFKIVK